MTMLALSFGAGLLTALSPCILPVVPIVTASAAGKHRLGPAFLALGLISSFVFASLVFTKASELAGISDESLKYIAAVLLVASGVVMLIPALKAKLSECLALLSSSNLGRGRIKNDLLSQFSVGGLMGFAWSPCIGPTLGIALGMASSNDGTLMAAVMMTAFGLGLMTPLLGIAYGFKGLFLRNRERLSRMNSIGSKFMGATASIIGVLILSGGDKLLEASLVSALPTWFIELSSKF